MLNKIQLHRKRNYDICMAVNLTSLGCVLDDMAASGDIGEGRAQFYRDLARTLLQLLRAENDNLLDPI